MAFVLPPPYDTIIWDFLVVFVTVIVAFVLIKIINHLIDRMSIRMKVRPATSGFLKTLITVMITIIAVLVAVSQFGIRLEIIYILLAVFLIALVFGFRDILENLMSHYALSGSVPLRKGDTIEIEGIRGNIARVGHLFTEVHTVDGKVHYIPNVIFLRKASSSYTRDSLMKVMVSIKISGDADISSAEEIIKKIVEDNKDITSPPEPEVVVSDFREEYTEFAVKFHVTNPNKSDFVASELRKIIRTELKKAGIKLA